jgi:hypothetical protein
MLISSEAPPCRREEKRQVVIRIYSEEPKTFSFSCWAFSKASLKRLASAN